MVKINLLLITRVSKKKSAPTPSLHSGLVIVLLLSVFAGFGYAWTHLSTKAQQLRTEKMQHATELTRLKKQVEEVAQYEVNRKEVEEKIRMIRQLKKNQYIPIHLLTEISERLPERIWLLKLIEQGSIINLEGRATSNGEIVTFINALKQSGYFEEIEIEESRQVMETNVPVYHFKLKWRLRTI